MVDCRTLLVRNLPSSLSVNDVQELLTKFGAVEIRLMKPNSKMKGCAFVRFNDPSAACEAMKRLHQLEILGKRLVIVYANTNGYVSSTDESVALGEGNATSKSTDQRSLSKEADLRLPAISEVLGINYPLNIKYKYLFPPPNPSVVSRISNTLINVPKFYWQVLLLMNKMNLPPPFGPADKAMTLGKEQNFSNEIQAKNESESSEESELDSEGETEEVSKSMESATIVPVKRKRKSENETSKKRRMQSILASIAEGVNFTASESSVAPSEVFDVPSVQVQKKIEFKLSVGSEQKDIAEVKAREAEAGSFGTFTTEPSETQGKNEETSLEFITYRELKENQISKEGMDILPVFKNYQSGTPSSKLYVKNLAKQTDEKKLKFIYGLFVDKEFLHNEEKFSIRLLKEGRMKGQAFISFPNDANAKTALEHTNGFVLYDKPIVVVSFKFELFPMIDKFLK